MDQGSDLADVKFAENPEPRCPCVLLLDTSGSMAGEPITALNEGLIAFKNDLAGDPIACQRVEVAVITFDSQAKVVQDFVTADQFQPPSLVPRGLTRMGAGILTALETVRREKERYKSNGIAYYRPWVFMITDGEPQGEPEEVIRQAADQIRDDEANKRVAFFAVGVENANMDRLEQIFVRQPVKLNGLNFVEMFVWLSSSMQRVSHSRVGDQVALPAAGWGSV